MVKGKESSSSSPSPSQVVATPLRVELSEPIAAWVGVTGNHASIRAQFPAGLLPERSKVTAVVAVPCDLSGGEVRDLLVQMREWARVTVVTPSPSERRALGGWGGWYQALSVRGVVAEEEPEKAVVSAMQWMRRGDALVVLWPQGLTDQAAGLVRRAERWRAAWEEAGDGWWESWPHERMWI